MTIPIDEARIKAIYNSTVDFLLESELFSTAVRLYYPAVLEECLSCSGSFNCLSCGGRGVKEIITTEDIRLRTHVASDAGFNKQTYKKFGINIEKAEGDIFALGNIENIPKMRSASFFSIYDNLAFENYRYILKSEPQIYGLGRDRYFYCFLNRENHIGV